MLPVPRTTLIYDDWYPAIRASEIAGKQMAKAILLGIPLVLGRKSDGKYFAMRDLCPHRGIPLSYGWFDGEQVTCKYHGWGFEPVSGQCREIPSLTEERYARSLPHLRDGVSLRGTRWPSLGLCPTKWEGKITARRRC